MNCKSVSVASALFTLVLGSFCLGHNNEVYKSTFKCANTMDCVDFVDDLNSLKSNSLDIKFAVDPNNHESAFGELRPIGKGPYASVSLTPTFTCEVEANMINSMDFGKATVKAVCPASEVPNESDKKLQFTIISTKN